MKRSTQVFDTMIKILITALFIGILVLTIISKIGTFFGFKPRSYAGLAKTSLIFTAILFLGAVSWTLYGPQPRDYSVIAGPAVVFLVALDVIVRQRKNNKYRTK